MPSSRLRHSISTPQSWVQYRLAGVTQQVEIVGLLPPDVRGVQVCALVVAGKWRRGRQPVCQLPRRGDRRLKPLRILFAGSQDAPADPFADRLQPRLRRNG